MSFLLETIVWCVFVTWNMSLMLFALPEVTSGEEWADLVSSHTLLPGRVRAREGKERTTTELSSTRDQNEYISGETQTFVSLSCQVIDSRVSGMLPFLTQVEWRNQGSEESYEGWRIILMEAGPLPEPVQGGWNYWGYEEETLVQKWGWTHRGEFWGLIHQDKTFLLPIMEHLSKCGLPLSIIFSHSLVVCICPVQFIRSFDSAM